MTILARFLALGLFALPCAAVASERGSAPYMAASDGSVERLPLVLTAVDVTIAGVIADVSVKQVYENRGSVPIEAIYVFPGSDRAAVYALQMTIGDRVVRARIEKKEEARAQYEEALAEGKTASLLEQLDPSIFRMSLANVQPGDRIEVELKYTELLVPEQGEYEFFFPNTVGSRYTSSDDTAIDSPTSVSSEVSDYAFDIRVRVVGALALGEIDSSTHTMNVERASAFEAMLTLDEAAARAAMTKDFLLRYRYVGSAIEAGILAYPEGDGGYFLLLAEPPRNVQPTAIVDREFIFVIDVSGSMHGRPLDVSKDLLGDLVASLRPTDLFNVVLFAGGSKLLGEDRSLPATRDNIAKALKMISDSDAGGGTELIPALETAYALPQANTGSRSIIIVTDGAIAAGGRAFRVIRDHLDRANVFAFGIGPSVERPVIQLLARAGAGEPFIVDELGKGAESAARLRSYVDRPLLTAIDAVPVGIALLDQEPQQIPDLLAERPLVLIGRYRGSSAGSVAIEGVAGGQAYRQTLALDPANASPTLSGLRQLWARQRIQRLMDEQSSAGWGYSNDGGDQTHSEEITQLGLDYGLLTPYTSFVAVDERVRGSDEPETVRQPAVSKGIGYRAPPRLVRVSAAPPDPLPRPLAAEPPRQVGDHQFVLLDGVWTDQAFRAQHTLRIRPGSAAWDKLLELCPMLADFGALGERVLVVLGQYAVLIAPDGFSDYPDEVLAAALQPDNG